MTNTFLSDIDSPDSIALLDENVFWTTQNSMKVFWSSKTTTGTINTMIVPIPDHTTANDNLVLLATRPIFISEHACQKENGKCSHICVSLGLLSSSCLCPGGMVFKDSQNITCIEIVDCEFRYFFC